MTVGLRIFNIVLESRWLGQWRLFYNFFLVHNKLRTLKSNIIINRGRERGSLFMIILLFFSYIHGIYLFLNYEVYLNLKSTFTSLKDRLNCERKKLSYLAFINFKLSYDPFCLDLEENICKIPSNLLSISTYFYTYKPYEWYDRKDRT